MRIWPIIGLLSVTLWASPAWSEPLEGRVVETRSRWAYGASVIASESLVVDADGDEHRVFQLGGSVDGIGMRMSHSPALLKAGDLVVLDTTSARSRSGQRFDRLERIVDLRRPQAPDSDGLPEGTLPFVRTENDSGTQLLWSSGCVLLHLASEGSNQVAGDEEVAAVERSLSEWQNQGASCSYFDLILEGRSDAEVGFNGINLIKFREELWCRPATDSSPEVCHDDAAAGLTTLFFVDDPGSARDGEILDADIELNGVNFAISVAGESGGTAQCLADLQNTLTHELGHLIGLDHTCYVAGDRLVDDEGNEVPLCSSPFLDGEITDATMYNFQSCGEVDKSTLEQDDIDGFCAIYPKAQAIEECKPVDIDDGGCCSIAGGPQRTGEKHGALLLAGIALVGLGALRRRRAD
jgi:hypothetical protein